MSAHLKPNWKLLNIISFLPFLLSYHAYGRVLVCFLSFFSTFREQLTFSASSRKRGWTSETRQDKTRREENELYCFQGGEAGEHVSNSNKYCLQFQVKEQHYFQNAWFELQCSIPIEFKPNMLHPEEFAPYYRGIWPPALYSPFSNNCEFNIFFEQPNIRNICNCCVNRSCVPPIPPCTFHWIVPSSVLAANDCHHFIV